MLFFLFLEILGVNILNLFDYMRIVVMLGGFLVNIRFILLVAGFFIILGVGFYVGFFYVVEVMKKYWFMFRFIVLVKIYIKGL